MTNSYNEELSIGDRIGSYEILSVLGQGSMGMVYKCKHVVLGRIVAIKTLRLKCMTDDRTQKRFVREAQMANRLNHPNLIGLVDFGNMANGDPYLVMEFVSGQSLFEIMKRERYLIPERAVNLFSQVAEGLAHAHQRGVIHRDLKPANMLVIKNEDGSEMVKIVDLGVAKIVHGSEDEESEAITMTGEVCGSPIYLSPEQCMYQELDARTDIYSLGVCMYECLTGVAPLRGATVYDTIYMHVHDMPRPFNQVAANPDIPRRLEEIVFRCLAKQPKDRYDTMASLKHELMQSLRAAPEAPAAPVNVLPPESLFGPAQGPAKKASGEYPRAQQQSSGSIPSPPHPFGKTSGQRASEPAARARNVEPAARHADEEEEDDDEVPHVAAPRAKDVPANLLETAGKKRKKGKGASSSSQEIKAQSSTTLFDQINVRTVGLMASLALVFFGFGSVFAYFIIKSNAPQNPAPIASTPAATPGTEPAPSAAKTDTTPKPSAFAEPILAAKTASAVIPAVVPAKTGTAATKPPAKTTKPATPPKPINQPPMSMNDMNRLLDTGIDGSQGRFNAIVEQAPVQHHGKGKGGKAPQNRNMQRSMQQQYHLKPGRYMPPARPMPTLRRGPMTGGGMPMQGMPMGGPGMGGPGMMQRMPGGSMLGSGQMPMMNQMPPIGGGQMPPMGGGGGGGGFMDKIKAFIASQSGGAIPMPNQQQQPVNSFNQGPGAANQQAAEQQANFNHEGTQLLERKQWAAAVQKYEQAYRLDPSNMDVKTMYAYALNAYAVDLNKQRQFSQAAECAKRAASLCPDNPRYQKNYHNFLENAKAAAAGTI